MPKIIKECRICGNKNLTPILNLGNQCLTSVYPHPDSKNPSVSPLELLLCNDDQKNVCNLVQLRHNADIDEMYGTTYGYFSSISSSMVDHLKAKVNEINNLFDPQPGDLILDIGCNDGTLLNLFEERKLIRFGIDPSSKKFIKMFQKDIKVSFNFFSENKVKEMAGDKKFKVITSIAMFYDIDDPTDFMKQVHSLLKADGIWVVEIAYLPTMMKNLAYDQVMHEHLTYLGLNQMKSMMDKVGFEILDVSLNDMNGGSINIITGKKGSKFKKNSEKINSLLLSEKKLKNIQTYKNFENRIKLNRNEIKHFFSLIKSSKKSILGYGASTKGNVVLNYCEIKPTDLEAICDQNPEKPGLTTPGTRIPIISKKEMRKRNPDYLFVLIWHFRKEVLEDEKDYIMNGGILVFGLPRLHFVNKDNYQDYINSSFDDLSFSL